MTDRWERLTDLYHVAVALPEDERASLLTEACADDPALQAEIERLVAAHYRVSPPVDPPAPRPPEAKVAAAPEAPPAEPRTAQPRPDPATEHADGATIDVFADARQLSIAERLGLFVQVCDAVSTLHRRGVTHGALDTTTIRVSKSGVPKIIGLGTAEFTATVADDIHALGTVLRTLLGSDGRGLRDDLEAIVRTALRQNARRRYGTVEELAADVRLALDNFASRARVPKRATTTTRKPSRSGQAILAWALAAVALVALGVKVAPLLMQRASAPTPEPSAAAAEPAPMSRVRVLVPDFLDHTGDPRLVAALSDAFRTGLTESPAIIVVSTPDRRVDAEVRGSIDTVAAGYSFIVRVTRPAQGDSSPALVETATDSASAIRALGTLAERLREHLGETPASIAATPKLDEVTTASLPALRAYANATRAINAGDRTAGLRSLNTAVALDTGFAAAHRLMAVTYSAMGNADRAADALDRAIANYTRLPYYTRYHTVGTHAMNVLGHHAAAIDAYNKILERYPDDVRALEGLGRAHAARREYAVQESLLVRAIAADSTASLLNQLTLALVNQGKYGAARRTLDRAERRFPGTYANDLAAVSLAASQRDWATAEREAIARLSGPSRDEMQSLDALETLASIRLAQGRIAEAERDLRRVVAAGTRRGAAGRALRAAVRLAYVDLRYRRAPAAALGTVNAAVRRYPLARIPESDRPYDEMARFFADAGQPGRAVELIAEAGRTRLGRRRVADADRRWTMGVIATAEGRAWEGEIEIFGAAETHPCPICVLPDLARAYEVAGKPDSAIATYERYLSTPWQSRFETDAIELGFAMERLGALYQQQRDASRAAALYAELLQLWRGADSELQPLIADVRRRLEQTATLATSR